MGVPNFMIAPALSLIVAQRLVRRLCECAEQKPIQDTEREFIEKTIAGLAGVPNAPQITVPQQLMQAKGCEKCVDTGYRGVLVIAEALWLEDAMREVILRGGSSAEIFKLARDPGEGQSGMITMTEDALLKVLDGKTTIQEIHRVTNA
ncbi:hypothetical protein COV82_04875 [Candidatus Peregrinibacteria bacterium CG11_big_fil_rev_8_21_14_0_20_46_8]|nr:MAG: hypothetical protein COV82_04875 [Candidatus Peregrinibacteria bacterium CG11_big_fil_rev_8_21_14_0_20_46_8]